MEKYFKVTFHAELHKFALAFKTDSDIDLFWKKGTISFYFRTEDSTIIEDQAIKVSSYLLRNPVYFM